ncbi:hypothetical protein DM01DRAFT_1115119 [Hesseltinella vesiculosa]|uniref:Cell division control protein 24 OB domain-containing protein n=1 Tax=Hesseltinella vesiculosa TaxID=101127 RepID=A0A1X2GA49_9FUNG|nr:hypothetical protein DM01DRAFT_1115119 [Hesseltinella vesiculosa]
MEFAFDRRVYLYCNGAVSSVSNKRESDHRQIYLPPTNLCLWQLKATDAHWVKSVFDDTFASTIAPQSMVAKMKNRKLHRLWLRVIHVEQNVGYQTSSHTHPSPVLKSRFDLSSQMHEKRDRTDIYVLDNSNDTEHALISLYDTQCKLASCLQRGQYIGLYNPLLAEHLTQSQASQTDLVFECSDDTLLFVMSGEDANRTGLAIQESTSSNERCSFMHQPSQQTSESLDHDQDGLLDCKNSVSHMFIKDLRPSMVNVTLYGSVIAKAGNHPLIKDGKTMDRYAIRLEDETGTIDITLWEDAGQYVKKIDIGQSVLITGLSTSLKQSSKRHEVTTWFVNGSKVCGTMIFNLSLLECLLNGECFRQLVPLHNIQGEGQWQTRARIVGWDLHCSRRGIILSNEIEDNLCGNTSIADYVVGKARKYFCSTFSPGLTALRI